MLTIDQILAVADPSPPSHGALDQALVLGHRCDATVHVLAAFDGAPTEDASALRHRLSTLVAHRTRHLGAQPSVSIPSPSGTGCGGEPASLLAYAQRHDIGLIVADTPSDRGPIPALASSAVRTLAEKADVPLFVVRDHSDTNTFQRILVPTDFSDPAASAFEHANELAALYDASLDVLHVMERPRYVALNPTDLLAMSNATLPERNAQRRLDDLIETAGGPDVPIRTHLRHGDATDQICHFVDEEPVDLVVLSTHEATGRRSHPLGNVADKVLRRVTAPIFLTRAFGRSLVSPSAFL